MAGLLRQLSEWERLNFLLTNRIPRRLLTRFMGWYSRIQSPWLTRMNLWVWRLFADDLNLEEASEREFSSLQACFTRALKPGVRPLDPRDGIRVSPCDGIVGACGRIEGERVYQAKGFPYELAELVPDPALRATLRDGVFVTLRLTSSMYHRFHAPADGRLTRVDYVSGDTWNVNPVALKRIQRLYCRNERAVLQFVCNDDDTRLCLVAVAAILVASIRLHCLGPDSSVRRAGAYRFPCDARYRRGDELGYFEHGSTILLFAPAGHALYPGLVSGQRIRMGEALLLGPVAAGRHRDFAEVSPQGAAAGRVANEIPRGIAPAALG